MAYKILMVDDDRELLKMLNISKHIVTIDAMGTQKAIAEKIQGKRAEYVLALKRNQAGYIKI